jgi:hypothetical protein
VKPARYDDEPAPTAAADGTRGQGKKQLAVQARNYERLREVASEKDGNFDDSEVAFSARAGAGLRGDPGAVTPRAAHLHRAGRDRDDPDDQRVSAAVSPALPGAGAVASG